MRDTTPDQHAVFAFFAFTGKGRATRRQLLASDWHNKSPAEVRAVLYGATMPYWAKGTTATLVAYYRDDRDGSGAYWTLFDRINDDNRRDIPRYLTPDLSDAYYPEQGRSAGELAALWHIEPPALTYGLAV